MAIIAIVPVGDLTVFETTMQAVAESFAGNVDKINREAIRKISTTAEKNFAASILRPATSKTKRGTTYRAAQGSSATRGAGGRFTGSRRAERVSGKFTFGPNKTFTGSLFKKGLNVKGFGYPIVGRADQRTKRVWRGLEFGWDSMRMPSRGHWRAADGKRLSTTRSLGGDAFFPAGPADKQVEGIAAKLFITKAFKLVVKTFVEPGYQEAAKIAAKSHP